MEALHLCLTLILFHVSGTWSFQWISAGTLPNGTVIPACPGQDVTLAWSYTAEPEEHLNNVEWHYTPSGGVETLLATQVMGVFVSIPGFSQHVQFIANAGIRLQHVATADAGTYSVHIMLDLHGTIVRQVHTVQVQVSDQGVTTDGQLHVEMLADPVYDNSTQQFHVQLACGHFLPVWSARNRVVWKTPSGQSLPNTAYDNGRFLLSVPNPVVSGEYTCVIDNTSLASLCVGSGSPLHRASTVNVDGVQARFALVDARINSEEQKNKELETQMTSTQHRNTALESHVNNLQTQLTSTQQKDAALETHVNDLQTQLTSTQQKDAALETQVNNLQNQLTSTQQKNTDLETHVNNLQTQLTSNQHQLETVRQNLTSMILTAARSVSFHARRTTQDQSLNIGDTLIFDIVYSNEGGAYSATTGVFTVPVDGTYAFFITVMTHDTSVTKNTEVYLAVDGAWKCYAYSSYESGQYESNSCSAVLLLRAGQHVSVLSDTTNSRYNWLTSFSGALLHAAMP